MEVAGIKFAPLNVPLERRLQTLAAAAWFFTMVFGGFISPIFTVYLVFYTRFWWITLVYLVWVYVDRHGNEREYKVIQIREPPWGSRLILELREYKYDKVGNPTKLKSGRPSEWAKSWIWFRYFRDYFPLKFERLPCVELDPKKNYLFCVFPHGMTAAGAFNAFATNYGGFNSLFPHHSQRLVTLTQNHHIPFYRELSFILNCVPSSAESIDYILRQPGGGRVATLVPGGAAEAYYCKPGQYKVVLQNRRGFVKLALKNGAPLVPVISFGETDLFDQVEGPVLRKVQEAIRKVIGVAPVVPIGRGFFQYSFGIIPRRKPVTTVVGEPMDVPKIEKPTREDVEKYHAKFVEHLTKFFEEQKYNYLENPEKTKLEIA